MQREGRIEKFDVVLLAPTGELNGYIALHGSAEQLAAVRESEEFQRSTADASLVADGLCVIEGFTNEGVATQIALCQESLARVPQTTSRSTGSRRRLLRSRQAPGSRCHVRRRGVYLCVLWRPSPVITRSGRTSRRSRPAPSLTRKSSSRRCSLAAGRAAQAIAVSRARSSGCVGGARAGAGRCGSRAPARWAAAASATDSSTRAARSGAPRRYAVGNGSAVSGRARCRRRHPVHERGDLVCHVRPLTMIAVYIYCQ